VSGNGCTRRTPRFGRKVTLSDRSFHYDAAFYPRRLRLADIDGSGHADVVSVTGPGATMYVNRSGNDLADPVTIPLLLGTELQPSGRLPTRHRGRPASSGAHLCPPTATAGVAYGELMAASSHGGSSGCLRRLPPARRRGP
jgi:hypothetical protein